MFFGNFLSTLATGAVIVVGTNIATWFFTDQKATERCMNRVAAAAYEKVITRQQLLARLNARAAKRAGRSMTAREIRMDRFMAALDVIQAYPDLKNCEIPAEVREALDAINHPEDYPGS